ncbi:MAG: UDP-N-acetylmuramate dehydrogenase [Betaproteobacteria bacterium]|nr:UDP-N-acetylmuramate dehydrogenase [Betaproteobacteria bacterium]
MNMADQSHLLPALRGEVRRDEPMRRHVSWRTGGAALQAFIPADLADLAEFLRRLPSEEPVCFVGLGSNLLIRDGGFAGTVVLCHDTSAAACIDGERVFAPAGIACPKVARFAATHGFEGAEFLAGIPGTVGGALAMNAGCYGSDTWTCVEQVRTIDRSGELRIRRTAEYDIGYRHCSLRRSAGDEWFVGAWFRFRRGDAVRARERIRELLLRRIASQPLGLPNAGSVFSNPPGDHAARLIEACALKGSSAGGASISTKHANFIVNPGGSGSAADIEALIERIRAEVLLRHGVELVPEVRIIGERA